MVETITVQARVRGVRTVKLAVSLAIFARRLRLIDDERVVAWVNAVLARCRVQTRVGGRWTDAAPIKARVSLMEVV